MECPRIALPGIGRVGVFGIAEMYGYDSDDEDSREWFPNVERLDGFSKVFGVGNVFVMIPQKEGYSYVGLECGCTWDDEHGLGFLLHKDRLVNIGQADAGFSTWEAYKDNGTYERKSPTRS